MTTTIAGARAGRAARTCGRQPWAELLKCAFALDALRCRCGVRRRILAAITQAEAIVAIFAAPDLATEAPGRGGLLRRGVRWGSSNGLSSDGEDWEAVAMRELLGEER